MTLSHHLPVNDSLVLREAEHSGSGVSFLRLGSHTSYLDKPKAQFVEAIYSFPVLVKSRSNPYRISEFMAQDSHFLGRRQVRGISSYTKWFSQQGSQHTV